MKQSHIEALEQSRDALRDIINAAAGGNPYTPNELQELFIPTVDMVREALGGSQTKTGKNTRLED